MDAQIVDTVLAQLYTHSGDTPDLLALISGPNDIVPASAAPALIAAGRFDALCRLYRARGAHAQLLDAWSRCVLLSFFLFRVGVTVV